MLPSYALALEFCVPPALEVVYVNTLVDKISNGSQYFKISELQAADCEIPLALAHLIFLHGTFPFALLKLHGFASTLTVPMLQP